MPLDLELIMTWSNLSRHSGGPGRGENDCYHPSPWNRRKAGSKPPQTWGHGEAAANVLEKNWGRALDGRGKPGTPRCGQRGRPAAERARRPRHLLPPWTRPTI